MTVQRTKLPSNVLKFPAPGQSPLTPTTLQHRINMWGPICLPRFQVDPHSNIEDDKIPEIESIAFVNKFNTSLDALHMPSLNEAQDGLIPPAEHHWQTINSLFKRMSPFQQTDAVIRIGMTTFEKSYGDEHFLRVLQSFAQFIGLHAPTCSLKVLDSFYTAVSIASPNIILPPERDSERRRVSKEIKEGRFDFKNAPSIDHIYAVEHFGGQIFKALRKNPLYSADRLAAHLYHHDEFADDTCFGIAFLANTFHRLDAEVIEALTDKLFFTYINSIEYYDETSPAIVEAANTVDEEDELIALNYVLDSNTTFLLTSNSHYLSEENVQVFGATILQGLIQANGTTDISYYMALQAIRNIWENLGHSLRTKFSEQAMKLISNGTLSPDELKLAKKIAAKPILQLVPNQ